MARDAQPLPMRPEDVSSPQGTVGGWGKPVVKAPHHSPVKVPSRWTEAMDSAGLRREPVEGVS